MGAEHPTVHPEDDFRPRSLRAPDMYAPQMARFHRTAHPHRNFTLPFGYPTPFGRPHKKELA
ncbi:hypothetical protein GCM10011579_055540 [Streptomyces albiflavescens]|uniref:Uncharacterized protein n=1 Tax=Streptomyces albiflavescens TaxID=1623582 RepID=A0A917Y9Z2_9ACTN|nr:hypothetical protein GCM10011579_055540 [Streptomyces albiflavescens]